MPAPQTEVLITVDGAEHSRRVLGPGDYIIGRNPGCHLHIEADLVSREHAMLILNYDGALIEDLGSSNGTYVNDQPVTERTRLWPSQKIRIGAAMFTLRRLQGEQPTDMSLAPAQQAIRRMLPADLLREKKYDIGAVIARGGMGAILDAKEAAIKRRVAMKVMLDTNDAADIARFVAEAKVTGQLEHPNIVPVHELGVDENGQPFYTMKMVKGVTLKKVLELLAASDRPTLKQYPLPALLTIFQKVCDAVAFAHAKGVIHRDLKPENVMVGEFGEVLVMDWGLAKVLDAARVAESIGPSQEMRSMVHTPAADGDGGSRTMSGTIMGTPQYMAPEQARGEVETMDQRADIFSLGGILYTILTLRPPVEGKTLEEVLQKVASGSITPPSVFGASTGKGTPGAKGEVLEAKKIKPLPHVPGGRVPAALSSVVMKALSLQREDRYQSVAAFSADIAAYQNGFATGAENAGLVKHLVLLVKRHRGIFATGLAAWFVITALAVWFVIHLRASERNATHQAGIATANEQRANETLGRLRATAPTFHEQAKNLTEQNKLPEALEKIGIAITLNSVDSSFHTQRGNILQSMERFTEAADAYAAARSLNPAEANAAANIELSRLLATKKPKDGVLSPDARLKWRDALSQQGRHAEAILAGSSLTADPAAMLSSWQAKIDGWLGKDVPRIQVQPVNGLYGLDIHSQSISELSPLRGMPLGTLNLSRNSHVTDLGPLKDSPLGQLYANDVTDLADLSPLRGKEELWKLHIAGTSVNNLEVLSTLPKLQALACGNTKISDLSPLQNSHLEFLEITATPIESLAPIRGQPLQTLIIDRTRIADLSSVKGAKLKFLSASECKFSSLEALRGMPLQLVRINRVHFESLEPLAGAPLEEVEIEGCGHVDLTPLKGKKLRIFAAADGTTLEHLEVLAEMDTLEIVTFTKGANDPGILRKLPRLRKLDTVGWYAKRADLNKIKDAEVFWKEYDAQQAAKK